MGHNGIEHKGNGYWITKDMPPSTKDIPPKYRPNLYDNSLKVPAIVRWPKVIAQGKLIDNVTTNLDWYPTILEMAGVKNPENVIIRGRSLLPVLKGEAVEKWTDEIFTEYSMIHYATAFMRSYRTSNWKLIRDFNNPERDELYNISKDPEENINLIHDSRAEIKDVISTLSQKIMDHMTETNDPLLKKILSENNKS